MLRALEASNGEEAALPDTMNGLAGGLAVLVLLLLPLLLLGPPWLLLLRRCLEAGDEDVIGLDMVMLALYVSLMGGAARSGSCRVMVTCNGSFSDAMLVLGCVTVYAELQSSQFCCRVPK